MSKRYKLAVAKCSKHGVTALILDKGDGSGTRLTAKKCCGRWDIETDSWTVGPKEAREIITELDFAVEEMEK